MAQLGQPSDRFKSNYVQAPKASGFDFMCCLMFKAGVGFALWDTSDVANKQNFNGIVFSKDEDSVFCALRGVVPTSLADGDYYCDSAGELVSELPAGSFDHIVGTVTNGLFKISESIVPPVAIGVNVAWGDIIGNIENQTDLTQLLSNSLTEAQEIASFLSCDC